MKTSRRKFIESTVKTSLFTTVASPMFINIAVGCSNKSDKVENDNIDQTTGLTFTQQKLGYDYAALEPFIDAATMEIHYTKHHTAYVKNANEAVVEDKLAFSSETEFFDNTSKLSAKARNNGGGVWNHNFFWQSMAPTTGANEPTGIVAEALQGAFGSVDKFKELFTQAAMTRFGSGWAWLVNDKGLLVIGSTPNQDNPLMDNSEIKGIPILAIDVWEHAYYLKYQNKRNEYIANWWNVVNWNEVASRLT